MIFSVKSRRRFANYWYAIKTYSEKLFLKSLRPFNTIIGWGDSLTKGIGGKGVSYPKQLSSLASIKVINKGIGGQTSTQIKNRMIAESHYFNFPVIIWVGRNNYKDNAKVKADIAEIVSKLKHTKYLILSIINADRHTEFKGTENYNKIVQLNSELQKLYSTQYINVRSFLVSNYDATNDKDLENYKNDVIPSSLRSDDIHLNAKGYSLVAKLINDNLAKIFID